MGGAISSAANTIGRTVSGAVTAVGRALIAPPKSAEVRATDPTKETDDVETNAKMEVEGGI